MLLHSATAHSIELTTPGGTPGTFPATTIPIEIRENFPVLVATIGGIDVPLKFDLGDGDFLALQQSVLDQVKAVPTGETAKMRGFDGVFEAPLFKVARLQLGEIVFKNVIARSDERGASYKPGASGEKGYLGTGLLKPYAVVLDYARGVMTLLPRNGKQSACKGTVVAFLPRWNGEPVTEAVTDLGRTILWWDTGSPTSFLRQSLIKATHPKHSGDSITTTRLIIGNSDFGPWKFDSWNVSPPGFDGVIGYDFFAKHVVCVDFPGNQLLISAAKTSS